MFQIIGMRIASLVSLMQLLSAAQAPVPLTKKSLGNVTQVSTRTEFAGGDMTPDVSASDDGKRLARVRFSGTRLVIDVDGVASKEWDDIGQFSGEGNERLAGAKVIFSPTGSRWAYAAREGAKSFLVVGADVVEIEPRNFRSVGRPRFSADGKRYAFVSTNGKGLSWVIVDGLKLGPYGDVRDFKFSRDGKHYAFVAHKSQFAVQKLGQFVVMDGQEGPTFTVIQGLQLSADGSSVVYAAETLGKGRLSEGWSLVQNSKKSPQRFQSISELQLSADGTQCAFIGIPTEDGVNPSGLRRVVINGKQGKEYTYIQNLKLSPNGLRHAYLASREIPGSGLRDTFVQDGREIGDFSSMKAPEPITFSPDSKSVAFDGLHRVIVDGVEYPGAGMSQGVSVRIGSKGSSIAFRVKGDDNITRVVVNGKRGPELGEARMESLSFSPQGDQAAYVGRDMKGNAVLIAGDRSYPLPDITLTGFLHPGDPNAPRIVWSPDGAHFALIVNRLVFLNGKQGPACGAGVMATFSSDSKHFAFACPEYTPAGLKQEMGVYLDGRRVTTVNSVFGFQPGTWSFNESGALVLLALVGVEAQQLTIQPPSDGMQGFFLSSGAQVSANTKDSTGATPAPQTTTSNTNSTQTPANSIDQSIQKAKDALKKKFPGLFGGKK